MVPADRLRDVMVSLDATRPRSWRSAGHLAVAALAYVGLAIAAVEIGGWWRLPLWWCMAWLMVGHGAVVHETLHQHLFRVPLANRVVGQLWGAWVLMPWGVYRGYHLGHHQHPVTEQDPEGAPYRFTHRAMLLLLPVGGPLFIGQLWWWMVRTVLGRPPVFARHPRTRRLARTDLVTGLAMAAGLGWWFATDAAAAWTVWGVPWLLAICLLMPVVLVPEHYAAVVGDPDPLATTSTVRSNPVVTWVYWANNFHATHHVAPRAVPQCIPALSREVVEPAAPARWVSAGYLRFHAGLVRSPARFVPAGERPVLT